MFRKRDVTIHFVGIGGIGMSGIAEVLLNLGYPVSGSDLRETDVTRRLGTLGARLSFGHRPENVAHADVVVISSAVRADNPEVATARARSIPVIPRAEMLGELMRVKDGVAVAGSHGKTTTTTMIAVILAEAGLDPTAIIGGKARAFGSNARLGQGEVLVAEADESDGSFRHLFPTVALITNIDREHLDHFGSMEALESAFLDFAEKVPFYGLVVIGADNPTAARLPARLSKRHLTYGLHTGGLAGRDPGTRAPPARASGSACATDCTARRASGCRASTTPRTRSARSVSPTSWACRSPRRARRWRRSRASTGGSRCGVRPAACWSSTTTGTTPPSWPRRSPRRACTGGACWSAFQPHRYTRTRDLLADFAPALSGANQLFLTDVYPAGEAPIAGADARALLATFPAGAPARHVPRGQLTAELARAARRGDLVLCLGAGDITAVPGELLAALGAPGEVA